MYGFAVFKNQVCQENSCGNYCPLCFMDTRLSMLPVNNYTNDLTQGERQNKQYTNKYIIVYIL